MRRLAVRFTDYEERILSNLEMVCPNYSNRKRVAVLEGCLDNCGRMFAEYYSTRKFVKHVRNSAISGPGINSLMEAHLSGQSVILATGHFGNFEAGRAALINEVVTWQCTGLPSRSNDRAELIKNQLVIGGLYRPTSNVAYERHHLSSFSYIGEPAIPKGKAGLRDLLNYLRGSGWIMFLHDQHDINGIRLKFMGVDALASTSAAQLALRYNSLLIPYYGIRQPNGVDFEVLVENPIEHTTAEEMTQKLSASLEARVEEYPEQWFWVHRRWRA